jgi:hypothetical protein
MGVPSSQSRARADVSRQGDHAVALWQCLHVLAAAPCLSAMFSGHHWEVQACTLATSDLAKVPTWSALLRACHMLGPLEVIELDQGKRLRP